MRLLLATLAEGHLLVVQSNLANSYAKLGRDEALRTRQEVYSGYLKLYGKEHGHTIREASNYAAAALTLRRFEEAKTLLRKTIPIARRVLGEANELVLGMRTNYARTLYEDDSASLDDLREAVATLEEIEPAARRVLGDAHPTVHLIEKSLQHTRAVLAARETPSPSA